jgi:hypothetical protein
MKRSAQLIGRLAGWLAVAAALGFLGREVWRTHPEHLVDAHASALALALGIGTLVYGLAGFLLAEAWRQLLGPGPAEAHPRHHRTLYGRTQIAKYLPGNCFHFVGRQIMGRRLGHRHGALALASLAETASLLLVGGALALPLIWSEAERMLGVPPGWAGLATAGVVTVLIGAGGRWIRHGLGKAAPRTCAPMATWLPRVVRAGLLHLAFFAVGGLILWSLAAAIQATGAPALDPIVATSILAMAWWAGFVVPGSSAGIGVREAALVLTLEPYLASDGAMVIALALRLITTFGDLLFFGLCSITLRDAIPNQPHVAPTGS